SGLDCSGADATDKQAVGEAAQAAYDSVCSEGNEGDFCEDLDVAINLSGGNTELLGENLLEQIASK
ncbi:MAG: hypothetical protein ACOCUH_02050, partial [Bacteriovoracia bacterium]